MNENRYRTKEEMIEYFKHLSYEYEVKAHRGGEGSDYLLAKAEAYELAAFELEHNMK